MPDCRVCLEPYHCDCICMLCMRTRELSQRIDAWEAKKWEEDAMKLIEKQRLLASEFSSLLTVITARVGGAKDYEDWATIERQTKDLLKLAGRLKNLATGMTP